MTIKASDQVVLKGTKAVLTTVLGGSGEKAVHQGEVTVAAWSRELAECGARLLPWTFGLVPVGLPLRAVYAANERVVFLVEYPPGLRTMPWIREDSKKQWGPGTTYRDVTIALPYVLFFITLTWEGALLPSSVYFRTGPLTHSGFGDALLDCHFLNCSANARGIYCWICSQHMRSSAGLGESLPAFVAASIENFWLAASNLSSEYHEGSSLFGKGSGGAHAIPDPRVHTVRAWEEASAKDYQCALQVPWNPAGRTVRDVFDELTHSDDPWPFQNATALGNLILAPAAKGGPS